MPAMAKLSDADLARLVKLLGMTGSAHAGEAGNAAQLAAKLLKERNATWVDVINQTGAQSFRDYRPPSLPSSPRSWRDVAADCLARPRLLTDWENSWEACGCGAGT